jgi:hypothetical protein
VSFQVRFQCGCIYFSRECAHVYGTHSRQQFLFSLFSRYSHYASWKTFTYAREDADFSLHPRPPSPPATYIFLSHSFHRSPHIITGAHIHTEVERAAPHPSNHPSIAHTALVFILLFKVTPGLLLRDRRPLAGCICMRARIVIYV